MSIPLVPLVEDELEADSGLASAHKRDELRDRKLRSQVHYPTSSKKTTPTVCATVASKPSTRTLFGLFHWTSQTSSGAQSVNLFASARGTSTDLLRARLLLEVQFLAGVFFQKQHGAPMTYQRSGSPQGESAVSAAWCPSFLLKSFEQKSMKRQVLWPIVWRV